MNEGFHPLERAIEDWHWWYQVRREILDGCLARLHLDPARALLLDIGCGTGGSSLVMARHGRVVGLDRSHRSFLLSQDRPYTHRVVGSAESLPFRDGAFDAVAALDILEHLDDDLAGAREIRRVLRPGGTAIVFVPAFAFLRRRHDDFTGHRRRYTSASLARTLRDSGFVLSSLGYFNLTMFLPQLLGTLAERAFPDAIRDIEYRESPPPWNGVFRRVFSLEVPLLRHRPLPFGTSVLCLARRD